MDLETIITKLKSEQVKLRKYGVKKLSVFGSVARGDFNADSDIDIAVELDHSMQLGLTEFYKIRHYLEAVLMVDVDLVSEPVRFKPRLQAEIDKHRVAAF